MNPQEGFIEVLTVVGKGPSYSSAGWFANGDTVKSVVFADVGIPVDEVLVGSAD